MNISDLTLRDYFAATSLQVEPGYRDQYILSNLKPYGVSEHTWQDYIAHRKAKKAPITQATLDHLRKEATKAGRSLQAAIETMLEHGWRGFDAEWFWSMRQHAEEAGKAGLTPERAHEVRIKHGWRLFNAERYAEMMALNPPSIHHESLPMSGAATTPATIPPPAAAPPAHTAPTPQDRDVPPDPASGSP